MLKELAKVEKALMIHGNTSEVKIVDIAKDDEKVKSYEHKRYT